MSTRIILILFQSFIQKKKLPKVSMFTGDNGAGKSTLINHFLFSIFDIENYNKDTFSFLGKTPFLKQFQKNIFSNIIIQSEIQIYQS